MEKTCCFTLSLLVPYNIENCLQVSQNIGNMALNGIFLDIYNKRNLFYFSLTLLFIEYINNHTIYCILLVLLSLIIYIISCIKWSDIIFYNMKN
jgi:hypothetical protein